MPGTAWARDPQGWSQLSVTADIGSGWRLNGEVSGRTEANERERQVLARAQVGHRLGDDATLWLGYARAETIDDDRRNGLEQRATGQLDWDVAKLGRVTLASRTRLEARRFRGGEDTSWRFREQVRLLYRVGAVQLAAGLEPFFALNRTDNAPRRFEQMRYTANVLIPLNDAMVLDVGYLNQRLHRRDGLTVNHVVPVTLRVSF